MEENNISDEKPNYKKVRSENAKKAREKKMIAYNQKKDAADYARLKELEEKKQKGELKIDEPKLKKKVIEEPESESDSDSEIEIVYVEPKKKKKSQRKVVVVTKEKVEKVDEKPKEEPKKEEPKKNNVEDQMKDILKYKIWGLY